MLKNYAEFNSADLNAIFGDAALIAINDDFLCKGISIDSRDIATGNAFVALNGERIDGHSKIGDAFRSGASLAIVSKEWHEANSADFANHSFIVVKDTLIALGELGNYHRLRYDLPIIAVAGSNGKTTTKELIAHLLSKKFNVLKTHQNFNNRLGVPLMLLSLNDSYTIAVLEIGTNEPGEVFTLSEMVAPQSGIVTNIGKEHLEKLIDLDGVEMEETSLFAWLHRKKGISFLNLDDERLAKYQGILTTKFSYSTMGNAMLEANISIDENLHPTISFKYNDEEFSATMQTIGLASAYNAVAAVAVALRYDVPIEEIVELLKAYQNGESHGYARMIIEDLGKIKILNDCYNANPSSMKMSLDTLAKLSENCRKYAVLGDMREMGEAAAAEHIDILKYAETICDQIFVIGDEMTAASSKIESSKIRSYANFDDAMQQFSEEVLSGYVLVKGSRGMKMEKFIEMMKI